MIFVAGISIAFFISALILVKKDKSKSDIILLFWMLLNAFHLILFYLTCYEAIYNYPYLLGLQFPFPLLHGVFLYYYVSTVTNQSPKKNWTIFLHLLPSLITYVYLIPFFRLTPDQKIEIFKTGGETYEVFQQVLLYAVFISGVVYVIWSSKLLQNHKKRIRNEFSNIEEINLKWLQLLTYGLGAVWSLVIFSQNDVLIFIGVSIFVITVGFFGIQQKSIVTSPEVEPIVAGTARVEVEQVSNVEAPSIKPKVEKEKYIKSGLTESKSEELYTSLARLIAEDKVYTSSELSLSELASMLDIHPNYLSEVINKKEGRTFYDYINAFRVEEFKRLIAIPENRQFTLMSIAYDCGFNSKSSFNRYFKKITGLTPSQYVKPLTTQKPS